MAELRCGFTNHALYTKFRTSSGNAPFGSCSDTASTSWHSDKELSTPNDSDGDEARDFLRQRLTSSAAAIAPNELSMQGFPLDFAGSNIISEERCRSQTFCSPHHQWRTPGGGRPTPGLPPPVANLPMPFASKPGNMPTKPSSTCNDKDDNKDTWEKPDVIEFCYSSSGGKDRQRFAFLVGTATQIVPLLKVNDDLRSPKDFNIKFMASPPLPAGLTLDPSTGVITSEPTSQGQKSQHTISANVAATANGVSLGDLPLTSCAIVVNIVDLKGFEMDPRVLSR